MLIYIDAMTSHVLPAKFIRTSNLLCRRCTPAWWRGIMVELATKTLVWFCLYHLCLWTT